MGPYLQALYFCYALGGTIAPLFTNPFLSQRHETSTFASNESDVLIAGESLENVTMTTMISQTSTKNEVNNTYSQVRHTVDIRDTNVHYAIVISGVVICITVVPFIAYYFMERRSLKKSRKTDNVSSSNDNGAKTDCTKVATLLMLGLLFFTLSGTEESIMGFLMTFVVKYMDFSKTNGSLITSMFWATFAGIRFVGIFCSRLIPPKWMLLINFTVLNLALVCLLISGLYHITILVWVSLALAGTGLGTLLATSITWAERHLFHLTPGISSYFMVMAAAGATVEPLCVGYFFDLMSPMYFCYILMGSVIVCTFSMATLFVISVKCYKQSD